MGSFYFYDLETSGVNARTSRIMQFGGIRTDEDFAIQDEWMTHVALTDEVLPEPDAVFITEITPQMTQQDGLTEAEFLAEFSKRALKRNTTIVGFNTIRFDDEFMRYTLWRNYYDAYEWQWRDGRSRWDLLDVVRMMRALRPEGIEWPIEDGKPTNRLELLTKANNIDHGDAHDALADTRATLELAKLIRQKQPKLFDFLLEARKKEVVIEHISPKKPRPFVYTSGRYSSDYEKTTAAIVLAPHPTNSNGHLVYDLRVDPTQFADWTTQQIAQRAFMSYRDRQESGLDEFPVKILQVNKAPAVAPLGVLDDTAQKRIKLSVADIESNLKKLASMENFAQRVYDAWNRDNNFRSANDPDVQLYDGFLNDDDREHMRHVQKLSGSELKGLTPPFKDDRLKQMWPRYVARNFPNALSDDQRQDWEAYRARRLSEGVAGSLTLERYFRRLQQLAQRSGLTEQQQFLLEEMQLYGQSIAPEFDA